MKKILFSGVVLLYACTSLVKAQYEPLLGQIAFVPYNFVPQGWAACNGQIMQISQNTALFSLLGTTYGGNGTSTFALPDMRGRVPVHEGQAPEGGTFYAMGQKGGAESVALQISQMPVHNHTINAVTAEGNQNSPANAVPADTKVLDKEYSDATPNTQMKATMVNPAGGGQAHENRPPFVTLKCIIAITGIYPSHQ